MRKKSLIVSIFIIVSLMTFGCSNSASPSDTSSGYTKSDHQMTIKTIQKIVNHKKIIQQTIINQKKQQIQQL